MSVSWECVWTLVRAVAISSCACPVARLLASHLESATLGRRHRSLLALALPLLTPGFVVAYAYTNLVLSFVHSPAVNEIFYDLLVAIQVVPVGTAVLLLAPPPPLSASGAWCERMVGGDRLRRVSSCRWHRRMLLGPTRQLVPAASLMALMVFHEFEVASLFRVTTGRSTTPASWSNALFELIALQNLGNADPSELWRASWLPLVCSVVLLGPVLALAWTTRVAPSSLAMATPRRRRRRRHVLSVAWLGTALLLGTLYPLCSLIIDGGRAWLGPRASQIVRHEHLWHCARSLLPALLAAVGAATFATWVVCRRRLGLLIMFATPGLLGSLSLGVGFSWLVLMLSPGGLRHSILAMIAGQGLWLLPRAAVLVVLLAVLPNQEHVHLASLLKHSPQDRQRRAGWSLAWQHAGRRFAWMVVLLAWWAYLELTLNELLAPTAWISISQQMYQQMHFGRSMALSASTLVVILFPIGTTVLLSRICRWLPWHKLYAWGGTR